MFALGIYEWNRCNRIVSVSKEWRDFAVEIVDIDCRRECTMIALATRDGNEGQSNGEYYLVNRSSVVSFSLMVLTNEETMQVPSERL